MKSLLVSFLLLALVGLASCEPDPTTGTTTVAGQVVESVSRQPVAGATVQVYQEAKGGGYVQAAAPVQADGQGNYSLSFEATSTSGYAVFAQAAPGYYTPAYLAPSVTAGRANQNIVIPMRAPAWVRLQLVDELPKSRVVVSVSGYEGSGDVLYYPRDTTLIRPVVAGSKYALLWYINEGGVLHYTNASIQVPALDTVTVRIPF